MGKAESRKQKAESRKRKAESRKQKAESGKQKAKGLNTISSSNKFVNSFYRSIE